MNRRILSFFIGFSDIPLKSTSSLPKHQKINNINKNKSIEVYQLISLISGTEYENLIKDITQTIQKLLIEKENLLYQVTPNSENIKQINYMINI
jgi:hypothetical protein